MWFNVDFNRWAVQLLPPLLRSQVLLTLLHIFILPLRRLHERFTRYRATVSAQLDITAHVQYIEKALNDAFFLRRRQIYLETIEDEDVSYFHFKSEGQPAVLLIRREEGEGRVLHHTGEGTYKTSFTVYVPTFLCSSLDSRLDRYKGIHLRTILNILNHYKPAGRTYRIELYDYE